MEISRGVKRDDAMETRRLILDLDIVLARKCSPLCIHPHLFFANNTREISDDLSYFYTNELDHGM